MSRNKVFFKNWTIQLDRRVEKSVLPAICSPPVALGVMIICGSGVSTSSGILNFQLSGGARAARELKLGRIYSG